MRAKTRLLVGAAAVSLTLMASACGGGTNTPASVRGSGGTPMKGGTLNMLGVGDVDYMDPQAVYYTAGAMILRLWNRGLYSYPADPARNTTSQPDLADGAPSTSTDGLTVTVKLKGDAMWNTSPARAVTAGDAVIGLKRTCNPVQPYGGLPDYQDLIVGFRNFCDGFAKIKGDPAAIRDYVQRNNIEGVQALDDKTVVYKLVHPASYFQDMLTMNSFNPAPVEYLDATPGTDFGNNLKNLVSDGPYYVTEYTATKTMSLSRNPVWSEASDPIRKAYVDSIKVTETGTQESIQQQLQTGTEAADLEFDTFPPPTAVPGLVARKDPNLNIGQGSSSNPYLIYNILSPGNGSAMKDAAFRKAISTGINRANLTQVLGGNLLNTTLTKVLPANVVGGEQNFDLYPYDRAKAMQMLAASGKDGATVKILYRNASQGSTKVFQSVQQQLDELGLKAEGVPAPNADFFTKYLNEESVARRGVWDIAVGGWSADWYGNAAVSFFGPLFSGQPSFPPIGSNYGFYDNPDTNKLIHSATVAKTQDEAAALWAQADRAVMADAPFYPITNENTANYKATQVNNAVFLPSLQGFDPANVWLSAGKQGG
ncbi:ABC transporter substrate-binding protein [Microlunatus flavus]|uniref:Peptide/nickel transport system substrate-binding protein n=1 Tax=Microlunatus flavus TaxID=1036181 RepID=A0A1H9L759_9ACTN|nr:ABC transporter substrate-binding protein [Microlunatus flavus]SER07148.1 peptide/nickel transport system substrate-binding protein [Microlunatus flavus]